MKLLSIILPLLLSLVTTTHAQIRELWRSGLTNSFMLCSPTAPCEFPPGNYTATTAAIDPYGNTLVGGVLSENFVHDAALVAKFDPNGNKLWEFQVGTETYGGVEAMAVDAAGNIFFTCHLFPEEPRPLALIKVDPDGREQWRVAEFQASGGSRLTAHSAVATDAAGNSFFFGLIYPEVTPGEYASQYFLAKFDPEGRRLWRTTLPGYDYAVPGGSGLSKCMATLLDGSVVVVGSQRVSTNYRAVAAKFNAEGKLLWFTPSGKKGLQPRSFTSVMAAPHGTIVATGPDAFTVFLRNGIPIRSGDSRLAGEAIGFLPHRGFVLSQRPGYFLLGFGPGGRLRWSANTGIPYRFGTVSHGVDGWIVAGSRGLFSDELQFTSIDNQGNVAWQTSFPDYHDDYWADESLTSLLRAPDGTLRVVMNIGHPVSTGASAGVAVSAFTVETPARFHLAESYR